MPGASEVLHIRYYYGRRVSQYNIRTHVVWKHCTLECGSSGEDVQKYIEGTWWAGLQNPSSTSICGFLNPIKLSWIVLLVQGLSVHKRTVRSDGTNHSYVYSGNPPWPRTSFPYRDTLAIVAYIKAFLIFNSMFSLHFNLGSRILPRYFTLEGSSGKFLQVTFWEHDWT